MASDSCERGTMTVAVREPRSIVTDSALAGPSDAATKASRSSDHGTMSTCSLDSSLRMARWRMPFGPTQAPTGSMPGSVAETATFVRRPGSRAIALVDVAQDGVLCGLGRHALEVLGRERAYELAAVGANRAARDLERPGRRVQLHAHVPWRIEGADVGGSERRLDGVEHLLERNADLRAERRQGVRQAFGGRVRLRPRACPRQRHPTQCARSRELSPARPGRIPEYRPSRPPPTALR